jgi:hypothetical protein
MEMIYSLSPAGITKVGMIDFLTIPSATLPRMSEAMTL